MRQLQQELRRGCAGQLRHHRHGPGKGGGKAGTFFWSMRKQPSIKRKAPRATAFC
jgi:hypothetical protein